MNSRLRNFLIGAVLGAIILLTPIGLFNWYVDPFCFFNRDTYGMYWHSERYCKISLLKSTATYDSIIIGNSRAAWIAPDNNKTINLSFSGATYNEVYEFLEKYLEADKTVFIGIDYENFYKDKTITDTFVSKSVSDVLHHFFSSEITGASYANHFHRHEFKPSISLGEKGNRVMVESDWAKLKGFNEAISDGRFANFEFIHKSSFNDVNEKKSIEILKNIKKVLIKRNAKYVIFTNPILPARQEKLIKNYPEEIKLIKHFSSELKKIFPNTFDYALNHGFQNTIFRDPDHFSPEAGQDILRQLRANIH